MDENLMEQAVRPENVSRALRAVRRNRGAAGSDGMAVTQLASHLRQHGERVRAKLLAGTYTPSPVRRVLIPKPNGGTRTLGIPVLSPRRMLDRFVQQLLWQVLEPIREPLFSAHSYGFRPGRSAHAAVGAAREQVRRGKSWVVDIDITSFFDRVHHDILMSRIGRVVRDKRLLRLMGKYLRSGALVEGVVVASEQGTPQGGPLSPLLANIDLDALDKELEARGLAFVRYADDGNISVSSPRAVERVLARVSQWLARELRLEVNATKSGVGRPWERKFLGFRLRSDLRIEVAPASVARFKERVRGLWRSGQSLSSEQLRDNWCAFVRSWWGDYRLAEERRNLLRWEGWMWRHRRTCFWQRWHDWRGRRRQLRRLGVRGRQWRVASSRRGAWRVAARPVMPPALSKAVLRRYGFWVLTDLA